MQSQSTHNKLFVIVYLLGSIRTLLTNFHFLSFHRYRIPSRSRLIHEISDILQAMKGKIQISMAGARKINFCADIWSKKGLTSSYLGLTAHYYSVTNLCIEHPTLAVRELPHPHTGWWYICFYCTIVHILYSG